MQRQFLGEANWLKEPLGPIWTSYLVQMRQELGSYTVVAIVNDVHAIR